MAVSAKSDKETPSIVYYVQDWIGPDLMGSIALAFDPYWQFSDLSDRIRNPKSQLLRSYLPVKVIPVNRTRFGVGIFGFNVTINGQIEFTEKDTGLNGDGPWSIREGLGQHWIDGPYSHVVGTQQQVQSWAKDTTWKSRNPNAKITRKSDKSKLNRQGEFERSSWSISSMGPDYRSTVYGEVYQKEAVGTDLWYYTKSWLTRHGWYTDGLCATVSRNDLVSFESANQAFALDLMQDNLPAMLAKCLPSRRQFNLAYQITELKDLPATLRSSLAIWRDIEVQMNKIAFIHALSSVSFWTPSRVRQFRPLMGKLGVYWNADTKAADAYLTFKFGWQSIYQASMQLLSTPQRVTQEVNFLLSKQGKDVTMTTQKRFQLPPTAYPALAIHPYDDWQAVNSDGSQSNAVQRSIILRMVVNSGINLPRLDTPKLRSLLVAEKLGAVPTPKDLYDITPWTWMIDWFSGLGDYVNLVGMINSDRQLINFGFLTYKSVMSVTSQQNMLVFHRESGSSSPPNTAWSTGDLYTSIQLAARLENQYELRRSIQDLGPVKTYAGSGPLSSGQQTILGALFSKFL